MKKAFMLLLFSIICLVSQTIAATPADQKIISYGKDLTPEERILIFRELPLPSDVKSEDLKSVEVSNEEEWKLLKGLVPEEKIGAKAISSVYIEKLAEGEGLKVETNKLTFVTPQMFANALATAGVKDANIYATAPREVSGTAALTGMYKAIESLTGKPLEPKAKQFATQELVQTGDLGEKVGQERAALFVERAKEQVIREKTADSKEITKIVEDTAKDQNITLTEAEKNKLVELLNGVKQLNLNLDEIQTQLKNFKPKPEEKTESKPRSWLDTVIEFIQSIINQVFSFVGKIFRIN